MAEETAEPAACPLAFGAFMPSSLCRKFEQDYSPATQIVRHARPLNTPSVPAQGWVMNRRT
jgi:hypothetical protein